MGDLVRAVPARAARRSRTSASGGPTCGSSASTSASRPTRARTFLDELGVTFDQFADPTGELTDALGVAGLPVTLVVDDAGLVAVEHLGPMSAADLEDAIDEL